jgi:hypothetical protein
MAMTLVLIEPRVTPFSELHTFRCFACGDVRVAVPDQENETVSALSRSSARATYRRATRGAVCTENSNPNVVVMQSAENCFRFDATGPLNRPISRSVTLTCEGVRRPPPSVTTTFAKKYGIIDALLLRCRIESVAMQEPGTEEAEKWLLLNS